jgi:Alternative oxidase
MLCRIVFLETVAGVPGMVGGMIRHLHSLRLMRRDNGALLSIPRVCFHRCFHTVYIVTEAVRRQHVMSPGSSFLDFFAFHRQQNQQQSIDIELIPCSAGSRCTCVN